MKDILASPGNPNILVDLQRRKGLREMFSRTTPCSVDIDIEGSGERGNKAEWPITPSTSILCFYHSICTWQLCLKLPDKFWAWTQFGTKLLSILCLRIVTRACLLNEPVIALTAENAEKSNLS